MSDKLTRRDFIRGASLALAGLFLQGCGILGSNGSQPIASESTPITETPVEILNRLIRGGGQYESLWNIPDDVLQTIYKNTAVLTADYYDWDEDLIAEIPERTNILSLGEMYEVQRNHDIDPLSKDQVRYLDGKTYFDDDEKMRISLNAGSVSMQTSILSNPENRRRYPFLAQNVVEEVVRIFGHELWHYVAGMHDLTTVSYIASSGNSFRYDRASGFALYGTNMGTGARVANFGQIDEIAIALLERPITGQITAIQSPTEDPDTDAILNGIWAPFFARLGVGSLQDLNTLHSDPKGATNVAIDYMQTHYKIDQNQAFQRMVNVGNVLSSDNLAQTKLAIVDEIMTFH